MMPRLGWYTGASAVLAGAVVLNAFHQRANFYSAMVHLAQSNLSLLILTNLIVLLYYFFLRGLQRLCFGQLRPVEIEQLYEKGWFAVTETCLAMTIFREEIGGFFLVMFMALLTGKVWGWIGDGRVEILEQQPPANPRLFHTRLSLSLLISILYDVWMLHYATRTVIQQARPNMMVMFLFEFGVLLVCSYHTAMRYGLSLTEQSIIKRQTRQGLEERRKQIREQREDIERRRESGEATEEEMNEPLPDENDVEEMDIEVPGWEAKGHWVLLLDLCADFLKLAIYTAFFIVLLRFYGLPIHIMRDLFMTTRSFVKRLGALLRYRQAIKDLNRYPDATQEDLTRENTCIICREEMRPWDPNNITQVERTRPKKLPCGHILHFGCLKSWLERQQVCPTCRRTVVIGGPEAVGNNRDAIMIRMGGGLGPAANGGQAGGNGAQGGPNNNNANNNQNQQQPQPRPGVRLFNLGPIRLGFAQGGAEEFHEMAQMLGVPPDVLPNNRPAPGAAPGVPDAQGGTQDAATTASSPEEISAQLRRVEERIQQETLALHFDEQEAQTLRLLLQQLETIRINRARSQLDELGDGIDDNEAGPSSVMANPAAAAAGSGAQRPLPPRQGPGRHTSFVFPPPSQLSHLHELLGPHNPNPTTRHTMAPNAAAIPSGSADLPEGVTIPPGWSLLPLHRADAAPLSSPPPSSSNPTWSFRPSSTSTTTNTRGGGASGAPADGPSTTTTTTATTNDRQEDVRPIPTFAAARPGPLSSARGTSTSPFFNRSTPTTARTNAPAAAAAAAAAVSASSAAAPPATTTTAGEGSSGGAGEGSSSSAAATTTQSEVRPQQNQNGGAAAGKGKARAVTVEDEEDDDEKEDEDEGEADTD